MLQTKPKSMNPSLEPGEEHSREGNEKKQFFYNCHSHIFNFDHVHNKFLKGMVPWWLKLILLLGIVAAAALVYFFISSLAVKIVLLSIVLIFLLFLVFPLLIFTIRLDRLLKSRRVRIIVNTLRNIIPGHNDVLDRYANFFSHSFDTFYGEMKTQEKIFNELQSYYPQDTRFIVLSMDLEFMVNCKKPKSGGEDFCTQMEGLKTLKKDYQEKIYPFVHTDPRRIEKDKGFMDRIEEMHKSKSVFGIKIYPALGYFPFDRRLKPVYDLAIEHNVPVMTHCSIGPVYYRGRLRTLRGEGYYQNEKRKFEHPFTGEKLEGHNPRKFTPHFTHPLNYFFLMHEHEKLYSYWREYESSHPEMFNEDQKDYTMDDLKKYRDLKLCIGHYGGAEEWIRYLNDPWLPDKEKEFVFENGFRHGEGGEWGYEIKNKWGRHKINPQSWHSIISDMILLKENDKQVFPNLYSDISYNLANEDMLPLLKIRLETNEKLRKKILFGTDFYMVSMKASEREATMKLRAFIGEEHFEQIAVNNPARYLASRNIDISLLVPDQ